MSKQSDNLDDMWPRKPQLAVSAKNRAAIFDQSNREHMQRQRENPFSELYDEKSAKKIDKNDPEYGKPVAGSKTDKRGKQASIHINKEVEELCFIIRQIGDFVLSSDSSM